MKKNLIFSALLILLTFNVDGKPNNIYSCDSVINKWVIDNFEFAKNISFSQFVAIKPYEKQQAIIRTWTNEKKLSFWQEKINQEIEHLGNNPVANEIKEFSKNLNIEYYNPQSSLRNNFLNNYENWLSKTSITFKVEIQTLRIILECNVLTKDFSSYFLDQNNSNATSSACNCIANGGCWGTGVCRWGGCDSGSGTGCGPWGGWGCVGLCSYTDIPQNN